MHSMDSYEQNQTADEIDKICDPFLTPRGLTYFQFKRIYKDGSFIILANKNNFFHDFLEQDLLKPLPTFPLYTSQTSIYFWDEFLSTARMSCIRDRKGIYHGITIISRRKNFYDCTTYAMGVSHPTPCAYYFHLIKELQKFAELFPNLARLHLRKAAEKPFRNQDTSHGSNVKEFLLPKRSTRLRFGDESKEYITTYEALCMQLLQEGKSYKEIGSILSMAPSTVETHLKRLKARTGLTMQELSLQTFRTYNHGRGFIIKEDSHDSSPTLLTKKIKKGTNHK